MRVSQQEKERSHRRIVDSAARLVRERGVEGVSLADVMKDAGMTAGGFYRHFSSKEELVVSAVDAAFGESLGRLADYETELDVSDAVDAFERFYLSDAHVDNPGKGCPIPELAAEVGRNPVLKASMTAGVERMIERIAAGLDGSVQERRAEAAAHLAMMVGAVLLARATDPALGRLFVKSVEGRLSSAAPTASESVNDEQGQAK
ncbi:TetR/AcrR family transcriptional regulator [Mycobacterium sp. ML4]